MKNSPPPVPEGIPLPEQPPREGVSPSQPAPDAPMPECEVLGVVRLPLSNWLVEGLRVALLRPPRTGGAAPAPGQLMVLILLSTLVLLALARLEVPGPAQFHLQHWLAPMGSGLLLLWLAWWALAPTQRGRASPSATPGGVPGALGAVPPSGGVAAWYVLSNWAAFPATALAYLLLASYAHWPQAWSGDLASTVFWILYGVLTVWALVAMVVVGARFMRSALRTGVFAVGLLSVITLGTWYFPDRPWTPDEQHLSAEDGVGSPDPVLQLTQDVIEAQQPLLQRQLQALAPQDPQVSEVFGLVFAPFAGEEVFRRESNMVRDLLQDRFDAQGRVLHLLNHADTAATHAWATPLNLQRAIAGLAERMDREQDVLVVYLTSHGARDHALAAAHGPLQVAPATPELLRTALDQAGIRHRVVAVSACFSGGWIPPLATDSTLIMTAADATHTSYGCGTLSELTFFGRAVFDEQLRRTRSWTQAFEQAVPVIAQRETEAGKDDGFSNPQIHVGRDIAPVLEALAQRLDTQDASTTKTGESPPGQVPPPRVL